MNILMKTEPNMFVGYKAEKEIQDYKSGENDYLGICIYMWWLARVWNIIISPSPLWPKLKTIKPVEYPEVTHLLLNEAKSWVYRGMWARRLFLWLNDSAKEFLKI